MEIKEDAFLLASEILRKGRYWSGVVKCNIAMDRGIISSIGFMYNRPETPYFFYELEILDFVNTGHYFDKNSTLVNDSTYLLDEDPLMNMSGLFAVEINIDKLSEWHSQELKERLDTEYSNKNIALNDFKIVSKTDNKTVLDQIISNNKFSKMQKKIFKNLLNGIPKESKLLKDKINTNNLPSAIFKFRKRLKKYGLQQLVEIKWFKKDMTDFYILKVHQQ